jgi:hypothetical protein
MPFGNLGQNIPEIGFRVQTVEFCRRHECVDGSSPLTACIRTAEKVILPAKSNLGVILPMSGVKSLSITSGTRFRGVASGGNTVNVGRTATSSTLRWLLV